MYWRTILESVKAFARSILSNVSKEYLREPIKEDLRQIMGINAARGFPGCVGSIDCQHWQWKNCPIAWVGQFRGKNKKPTVVLEAACNGELWIWHAHFGFPGLINDTNLLDISLIIKKIIGGSFPPSIQYTINGRNRKKPYNVADGIYPDWVLLVKTIGNGGRR